MDASKGLFAGLAGIELESADYGLGSGVRLSRTYAHLMAHLMMAYTPAPPGKHHPAPWSAAGGGLVFDIHVQLEVPPTTLVGLSLEPQFIAWWITALLRLRLGPAFCVPVMAEQPFENAKVKPNEAKYHLIETEQRFLVLDPKARCTATEIDLAWVAKHWLTSSRLFYENGPFGQLFVAVDQSSFAKHAELALLWLWAHLKPFSLPAKPSFGTEHLARLRAFLSRLAFLG